ncbi:MAG: DNA replication and repair protein RecF [Bacteroidia bacterium]|nr:DNA replication and repair protein RecF [Bacteroidia bacterium]MDW8134292.1 DNA replication and repair protein RecF [Bacteroidia bacterium]
MIVHALEVQNFRSYERGLFEVGEKGVAWVGPNAVGKTTLLEAIYKAALLRGFGRDEEMIREGATFYRTRLRLSEGVVEISYERGKGTRVRWNEETILPLARWIGKIPVVVLRPADQAWIEGSAAVRRKWVDRLLCQVSPAYLSALTQYEKALMQRNALLSVSEPSLSQLEAWENLLIQLGTFIQQARLRGAERLLLLIQKFYAELGDESIDLKYKISVSPTPEAWRQAWQQLRRRELNLGRTLIGPHLEDFVVCLEGREARAYASEGQKKSLLISLKWAEVEYLRSMSPSSPLLLLDDMGEKLDESRLAALGKLSHLAAQIFVTDTDQRRVRKIFPDLSVVELNRKK